jgi:hypothetical protein
MRTNRVCVYPVCDAYSVGVRHQQLGRVTSDEHKTTVDTHGHKMHTHRRRVHRQRVDVMIHLIEEIHRLRATLHRQTLQVHALYEQAANRKTPEPPPPTLSFTRHISRLDASIIETASMLLHNESALSATIYHWRPTSTGSLFSPVVSLPAAPTNVPKKRCYRLNGAPKPPPPEIAPTRAERRLGGKPLEQRDRLLVLLMCAAIVPQPSNP